MMVAFTIAIIIMIAATATIAIAPPGCRFPKSPARMTEVSCTAGDGQAALAAVG
jgi:hypothetical protein